EDRWMHGKAALSPRSGATWASENAARRQRDQADASRPKRYNRAAIGLPWSEGWDRSQRERVCRAARTAASERATLAMSDHPDDAILAAAERRNRDRRIAQIVAAAPAVG